MMLHIKNVSPWHIIMISLTQQPKCNFSFVVDLKLWPGKLSYDWLFALPQMETLFSLPAFVTHYFIFRVFAAIWFISLFVPHSVRNRNWFNLVFLFCRLLKYFRSTHWKTIYFAIEKRSCPSRVGRYKAINNCQVFTQEREWESNCKLLRLFVSTLWEVINDFFGLWKWKKVDCQVSEREGE